MTDDYENSADFDEEAKRTLESEREDAETGAKYGAGFAAITFGLIPAGFIAWDCIQSVFLGARFRWSELWTEIGIIGAIFFSAWIYYRLKRPRELSDARLIRVELKLDRLLDLSEEISEGPKKRVSEERQSAGEQNVELPDKLEEQPGTKNHISEELDERLEELRVQIKLARLFARIEDDLREIRKNLTTAQSAREGEKGLTPQEVLNSRRGAKFPASESDALLMVDFIEQGLDDFETDKRGTADIELSFSRCFSLESLQEEVSEAASKSRSATLNEICDSLSWIHDRVNMIRESAAYARLEKEAEQGDASAQYELGIAYFDGQRGVQDYEEAYYWLCLATAANFATKDVGTDAVIRSRDDAASHLTPIDLSRVQGRAKKWIRDHFADLSQYPPARHAAEKILAGLKQEDMTEETGQ